MLLVGLVKGSIVGILIVTSRLVLGCTLLILMCLLENVLAGLQFEFWSQPIRLGRRMPAVPELTVGGSFDTDLGPNHRMSKCA